MYTCYAYGIGIHSDVPLPEFIPKDAPPDVSIRMAGEYQMPEEADGKLTYHRIAPREIVSWFRNIGRFAVREGREIVVSPAPDAPDWLLRMYILGTVFGALLHQRGLFLLHGSTLKSAGGAISFLGDSGSGKSTVAANLHLAGFDIVAEDIAALSIAEAAVDVFPGPPQIKVDVEAASHLGLAGEDLIPLLPPYSDECVYVSKKQECEITPSPLSGIYILDWADTFRVEQLPMLEAFKELIRCSYAVRILRGTATAPLHLRQCTEVVKRVPVYKLFRPRDLSRMTHHNHLIIHHVLNGHHEN